MIYYGQDLYLLLKSAGYPQIKQKIPSVLRDFLMVCITHFSILPHLTILIKCGIYCLYEYTTSNRSNWFRYRLACFCYTCDSGNTRFVQVFIFANTRLVTKNWYKYYCPVICFSVILPSLNSLISLWAVFLSINPARSLAPR